MQRPIDEVAPAEVAQWLAQAQGGSFEALGRLLDYYRPYLLHVANDEIDAAVRAKEGASDVVADAMLEALRDFARFRGATTGELVAWLRQILRHNLQNAFRRYCGTEKRQAGREVSLENTVSSGAPGVSIVADTPSPSSQAHRAEQLKALEEALARLPADDRQLIAWHQQDRLTFAAIGARLGISEDAAFKRWTRALQRLRKELPPGHGFSSAQ